MEELTKFQYSCLEAIYDKSGEEVKWLASLVGTTTQAFGRASRVLRRELLAYSYDNRWYISPDGKKALEDHYPWMTDQSKIKS